MHSPVSYIIARRYFWTKRKEKNHSQTILSLVGLSMGVMSLITTLGVMNGLQQSYISTIIDAGSGHLRLSSRGYLSDEQLSKIRAMKQIRSVTAETESQTMARFGYNEYSNMLIKGHDLGDDKALVGKLILTEGRYPRQGEILIGQVLASNLSIEVGLSLKALAMSERKIEAYEKGLVVSGIFKTGYYDYDASLAFVTLNESLDGFALNKEIYYKIMLKNRYRDGAVLQLLKEDGYEVSSWREFNRSFFSALRMEKNVMALLLSLIFVIVAVNIFQGRRRDIEERYQEIAILRAIGASGDQIMAVFIIQALYIGAIGSVLGLILAFTLSYNVTEILAFLELIINNINLFFRSVDHISLLSGESFYLENGIPILLYLHEIVIVVLISVSSSLIATYLAIQHITDLKPWQALRND